MTYAAQRAQSQIVAKELIQSLGPDGAITHANRALKYLLETNGSAEFFYGWALVIVAIVEASPE